MTNIYWEFTSCWQVRVNQARPSTALNKCKVCHSSASVRQWVLNQEQLPQYTSGHTWAMLRAITWWQGALLGAHGQSRANQYLTVKKKKERKIYIENGIKIWDNSSLWQEKQPRQSLSVPPALPDMEVCRYTVSSWPLPQGEKPSLCCARWGKDYARNTCRKELPMLIRPTLCCWPGGCSGVQRTFLVLHFFLQIQKLPQGKPLHLNRCRVVFQ